MDKIKKQLLPFILSVLILSFLTACFIFAFTDAPGFPAECPADYPGCDAPINIGRTEQTKSGALTVTKLTTSGGFLYLEGGNIERVDRIIGTGDELLLLSNEDKSGLIKIYGSELNFYANKLLEWQIDAAGSLAKGSVPWERLISAPEDCLEDQYSYVVGIEDGKFKCSSFIDYCEIIYKCAKSDGNGGCEPKGDGEYDLPACQKCVKESWYPVYYDANTYDKEGLNICDNTLGYCYACNGNGNCSFQTSDSDEGEQCGDSDCYTGRCSGTGYSCGTYTIGKQNCGFCRKCNPDGSGSCVNQTSDEDLEGQCPESDCHTGYCNGDGACGHQTSGQDLWDACAGDDCRTGLCSGNNFNCQVAFTGYQEGPGCKGVCYGCYNGVCTAINNQKDTYGINLCADNHYGCENGVCAKPLINRCINCPMGFCDTLNCDCYARCSSYGGSCVQGYAGEPCQYPMGCSYQYNTSCLCRVWKYD